jgi:hypothetical protein
MFVVILIGNICRFVCPVSPTLSVDSLGGKSNLFGFCNFVQPQMIFVRF